MPVIVKDVTDEQAMELALVENLQREDLDPVEEAVGIRELMTRCDLTQEQAARKLGKSRSALANSLRLLSLPETVLELLKSGFITIGHAKVVLGLPTPELQEEAAQMIADNQLNVRQAEALCKKLAKPAVPFGGKYRIIDFPLSNCVKSGSDTVGILTQYQPLLLNEYIGNGQPWDLDRLYGGVHVLPPYQTATGSDWYKGTANAIYQNIPFIERYNPDYVVVLSGDHIYKMDYSKMLNFHKEKNAACTIAVYEVPMAEASRFGILNTNEDGSIYEFDEKPKKPKRNTASMGINVFTS